MTNDSTPDLDDIQQYEEPEPMLEVPIRITNSDPIQVHILPARGASMRSIHVSTTIQQIVGGNLRRKSITVWASRESASSYVYIGTDKNMVESGSAARLPAMLDTFADGAPVILEMTHTQPLWAMSPGGPVMLSVVTEDWAD